MDNSADFLRKIKEKYPEQTRSTYATAKLLGFKQPSGLHAHKTGDAKTFGEETGYRIAELLDLPPAYVLACLAAERTKRPEIKRVWESVARTMTRAAMLLIGLVIVTTAGTPHTAKAAPVLTSAEYTLCAIREWLRRALCSRRGAIALLLLAGATPAMAAPGILAHQAELAELLPAAELTAPAVRDRDGAAPARSALFALHINASAPARVAAIRRAFDRVQVDLASVVLAYPLRAPASIALRVDRAGVTIADVTSTDPRARELAAPLRDTIARVPFPADDAFLLFLDVAPTAR